MFISLNYLRTGVRALCPRCPRRQGRSRIDWQLAWLLWNGSHGAAWHVASKSNVSRRSAAPPKSNLPQTCANLVSDLLFSGKRPAHSEDEEDEDVSDVISRHLSDQKQCPARWQYRQDVLDAGLKHLWCDACFHLSIELHILDDPDTIYPSLDNLFGNCRCAGLKNCLAQVNKAVWHGADTFVLVVGRSGQ